MFWTERVRSCNPPSAEILRDRKIINFFSSPSFLHEIERVGRLDDDFTLRTDGVTWCEDEIMIIKWLVWFLSSVWRIDNHQKRVRVGDDEQGKSGNKAEIPMGRWWMWWWWQNESNFLIVQVTSSSRRREVEKMLDSKFFQHDWNFSLRLLSGFSTFCCNSTHVLICNKIPFNANFSSVKSSTYAIFHSGWVSGIFPKLEPNERNFSIAFRRCFFFTVCAYSAVMLFWTYGGESALLGNFHVLAIFTILGQNDVWESKIEMENVKMLTKHKKLIEAENWLW